MLNTQMPISLQIQSDGVFYQCLSLFCLYTSPASGSQPQTVEGIMNQTIRTQLLDATATRPSCFLCDVIVESPPWAVSWLQVGCRLPREATSLTASSTRDSQFGKHQDASACSKLRRHAHIRCHLHTLSPRDTLSSLAQHISCPNGR